MYQHVPTHTGHSSTLSTNTRNKLAFRNLRMPVESYKKIFVYRYVYIYIYTYIYICICVNICIY